MLERSEAVAVGLTEPTLSGTVPEVALESRELLEYRGQARQWLAENMTPLTRTAAGTFEGGIPRDPNEEQLAHARTLQRRLFDAGYVGFTFPPEFGGQGLTLDHERVFLEEATSYDVPTDVFSVSINILGRTLADFATREQCLRYLPDLLSGKHIWVQCLSEPSGGSDLAGLLTRATRDGDGYIVNGQKTWSTGANHCDFAICAVRTDWEAPKHKGISVLVIDLHSPGVEIRPIKQIDEGAEFCEEFFTDVLVPLENRIGGENDGWRVTRGLLEIEHEWVGRSGFGTNNVRGVDELVAVARRNGKHLDAGVRRQIAALYVASEVHALASMRVSGAIESGRMNPGYGSALKLGSAMLQHRRAELGLALAGASGVVWRDGDDLSRSWSQMLLSSRCESIAGGTNEVLRNNIAERALGLPRERGQDRDLPFNEILRG